MAVISLARQLKRLPTGFPARALLCSLSCVMSLGTPRDSEQLPSLSEFEARILDFEKALCPESLVSYLEKTTELGSSLKVFRWASLQKRYKHTAQTYKMIILKLGMAGQVREMEDFCSEMARGKYDGADKSFFELIDSFAHNGRFNEALRVLHFMIAGGIKPSLEAFNVLMGAVVEQRRDLKDAVFVYKEMVKAGVLPDICTFNCLIDSLFESGRIDAAVDQYRSLKKKGCNPNSNTFRIVISHLAAMDRVQQSVIILEEIFQCGCEPDISFYTVLIPMFCNIGDLEIGMKLYEKMEASNITPNYDIYAALIKCLCDHLQLTAAIKFIEEMTDSSLTPDYFVYQDVVTGLHKIDKLNEAHTLLQERHLMNAGFHNAILSAYCDCGNLSMAEDKFNDMLDGHICDAVSWNTIIRCFSERTRIDKALKYLCQMIVHSFIPDSTIFSALILGYSRAGNVVSALALYHQMRAKRWVLDNGPYAEFVKCLCVNGSISEASDVFQCMTNEGSALEFSSLGMLIEKLCTTGEVKKAVDFLSLAHSVYSCSIFTMYNSILRGLSKSGQENYLQVMLSRMIVSGYSFEVETYHSLIQWMSSCGRGTESAYIFSSMIRDGLIPDSETLSCLLDCLYKYSKVHLVLPCLTKLASGSEILDQGMYRLLIDTLWRAGHKAETSSLLDLMLEKGWIPEASVHSLLMGSVTEKSTSKRMDDSISYILEEGLQSA